MLYRYTPAKPRVRSLKSAWMVTKRVEQLWRPFYSLKQLPVAHIVHNARGRQPFRSQLSRM